MEQLLDRPSVAEQGYDGAERLSREKVVHLGNLAIRWEVLGVNDPLTHLFQYIEKGDVALLGIEEDLVTDIAERLPKTPFVNKVGFEFTGDDFVSVKDRVSMKSMTANNLEIFVQMAALEPSFSDELARAEVESKEVTKLASWLPEAQVGAFLVFESLPIRDQKIAISRVYQKKQDGSLDGVYVSLHNPSLNQFNQLRSQMNPGAVACNTQLQVLSSEYEFFNHDVMTQDDFVDYYTGVYDQLMSDRDGKQHSFGIVVEGDIDLQNGITKARSQPGLTSVYVDTIRALASGEGKVNHDLLRINTKLGLNFDLAENQRLTVKTIHEILAKVITGIVSVIDRADSVLLEELAQDQGSNYDAVSHYGGEAQAAGETYSSGGCPEYGGTAANNGMNNNGSERSRMENAYVVGGNKLDDFGKAKMGVCRISGCPSHGNQKYLRERTIVGGCDICVGCHILFKKGKSPSRIYEERQHQLEKEQAEELAIREQVEEERKKTIAEQLRLIHWKKAEKISANKVAQARSEQSYQSNLAA